MLQVIHVYLGQGGSDIVCKGVELLACVIYIQLLLYIYVAICITAILLLMVMCVIYINTYYAVQV